jgi:serine/threonine protein kinase
MDTVTQALDGHIRYEWIKDLGSGTFGAVQLCKDKQSPEPKPVAVKLIPRGPKTVTEYVISEIRNFRCVYKPADAYWFSMYPRHATSRPVVKKLISPMPNVTGKLEEGFVCL